ncbi:sugar ABC transporter substrate-binding protein [Tessaracoccus sp. OS52]|uniref:ABC transporter substrate-binding protein n=1 Tax=Tessaracoccus sp. OS52 TaxID=2886691 RepID=UPI001D106BB1|nr:sugar ABC transporter substrate-binding protein [Tessaracoccus sp. OS52]MCC2592069.1 sugar ABC transporter substrate-binding protein [Tessaracoccus sp. OS52]
MAPRFMKAGAAALALGLLVACSGGGEDTPSAPPTGEEAAEISGEVTFRTFPISPEVRANADEDFWQSQVDAFNEEYPDIKVTNEVLPWADRDTALSSAIAGGVAPDLVYMIPNEVVQYQAQDALAPLQDFLVTDGYYENALQYGNIDGNQYTAPILMSVVPTTCKAPLLEQLGAEVPETWDDLLALGEAAKAEGLYATQLGFNPNAAMDMAFLPFVQQAGGSTFDEEGNPTLDSPEVLEAVKFLKSLADNGYIDVDDSVTAVPMEQSGIAEGTVVCEMYQGAGIMEPYWGDDRVVGPPLTNKTSAGYGTIGSFTLLEGSENKEAAAVFLNWITQPEQLTAIHDFSLFYPPKESAETTMEEGSPEATAGEFLDVVTPGVQQPKAREVNSVILAEMQNVLLGNKSPEDAVADMQAQAEDIVG